MEDTVQPMQKINNVQKTHISAKKKQCVTFLYETQIINGTKKYIYCCVEPKPSLLNAIKHICQCKFKQDI